MGNLFSSRINSILSLKSKQLESTELDTCTLKVLINKQNFCYCIIDEAQTIVALFHFEINQTKSPPNLVPKDFVDFTLNEPLLKKKYKEVVFAIQSPYQCIVANNLHSEKIKKQQFEICVPPLANNEAFQIIENEFYQNYSILFAFPDIYSSLLIEHLNESVLTNAHSKYVQKALQGNSLFSPKKMYLNVYDNNIEIVVSEGTTLQFTNTFQFINEKDFLYHILSVGKMNKFSFEENEIYLSGFLKKDSDIFKKLAEYAHRLKSLKVPKDFKIAEDIEEEANSFNYYNLYSL